MSIDPGSAPPSQAVVQITLGRVYDVVTETRNEVRDLKNSVNSLIEHVGDHETRMRVVERDKAEKSEVNALETRVGAVERKVWMGAGIVAVISAGVGVGATLLSSTGH